MPEILTLSCGRLVVDELDFFPFLFTYSWCSWLFKMYQKRSAAGDVSQCNYVCMLK